MENFLLTFIWTLVIVDASNGVTLPYLSSPCGDWTPYLDETCIKFVDRACTQTKEDAEIVCQAFSEELHQEDVPKLVTIKTKEKQEMVHKYLFAKHTTFDNVWLGLDMNENGMFHWNDGTKVLYSNWEYQNVTGEGRRCSQMESGEGVYEVGKWSRVNCQKRNAVLCETAQRWSVTTLQNTLISLMLEVEKNHKEGNEKINSAKQESDVKINNMKRESENKISVLTEELKRVKQESLEQVVAAKQEASQEINNLKQNPVPVGFVYVQLPGKQPPSSVWPQVAWKDVSTEYAGLFFRVEGGGAAPFGQVQEDNTRRLAQVSAEMRDGPDHPLIPEDGSWSTFRWTGSSAGSPVSVRYRLTPGEIRPRNKAVKIWQRV